jgi:hypothetical protein
MPYLLAMPLRLTPGAVTAPIDQFRLDAPPRNRCLHRWQEICELRRQQLEARKAARPRQLPLLKFKDDCLPAAERTAAGRYTESTLFADMTGDRIG